MNRLSGAVKFFIKRSIFSGAFEPASYIDQERQP